MAEPALPPDPRRIALAGWLSAFPVNTRVKGRAYLSRGLVSGLSPEVNPGGESEFSASVRGTYLYDCTLKYLHPGGWYGYCSCPLHQDCKHLYAVGTTLLEQWAGDTGPPGRASAAPDQAEEELVARVTEANGVPPSRKQLAWLRNLLRLFQDLRSGSRYYDQRALLDLIPAAHRYSAFAPHQSPFQNRWSRPPRSPLELWSHLALLFEERGLPLPDFISRLTDLTWARSEVAAHHREQELAVWRRRFSDLAANIASGPPSDPATTALRHLRLRLGASRPTWERSEPAAGNGEVRFAPLSGNALRDYLFGPDSTDFELAAPSLALATLIRRRLTHTSRVMLKLNEPEDLRFLGRILAHPHARACVVTGDGGPITHDPRPLVWHLRDHPENPDLAVAQLAFADGSPAPAGLLHLPGQPDRYLQGATVFTGLPPPAESVDAPALIPRAALALPEAGQFAVRAGVVLPGDVTGRFRRETLRPRLRAWLAPRRTDGSAPGEEVVALALEALAPDGMPRARHWEGTWRREGNAPDQAFLILDYEGTRAAVDHFHRLPPSPDGWHPEGPRFVAYPHAFGFPEQFTAWLAGFPPDTAVELAPQLAAFGQAPTRARLELDLSPHGGDGIDWFDVRVTLRAEDTTLTPEEIAVLHEAKGRFVRLPGKGWRRLTVEASPATDARLARLGLDATAAQTVREPLRFHALQLADEALQDALPAKLGAEIRARAAKVRAHPPPPVPAGLAAELRPYQVEGFHFLAFLAANGFGGVLADDMGLGKTVQTLAWLLWLAAREPRDGRPFRVLIICPKSVVVNWGLEASRFAPALPAMVFTPALLAAPDRRGGARDPLATLEAPLLVANYAQLRLHAAAFAAVAWDAVILDEGQHIKNPASATARAARDLRANHRVVLTGTPVENRLLDLWSLFAFAQPGLLGGQTAFQRLHGDKADPAGAHARLAARVRHFLLRRTKGQVARDLPPRIEDEILVELEGTQRTLYDAELKRARALLLGVNSAREFGAQRFNILQSLLRLRQICCDPRLLGLEAPVAPRRRRNARAGPGAADPAAEVPPGSAKLEALLETLEPVLEEGHKVLIFSQFVSMLELIRPELAARGIGHLILTGQTEDRQALVDRFQTDETVPVFLLSLKAAGAGLNLTAASYVVLFDPWWNPAVEAQAIDRTHRIGQRNQVIAYRLLARDTIEEKIRALQREKAALAAAVVQEESLASVLDLESLRRILS